MKTSANINSNVALVAQVETAEAWLTRSSTYPPFSGGVVLNTAQSCLHCPAPAATPLFMLTLALSKLMQVSVHEEGNHTSRSQCRQSFRKSKREEEYDAFSKDKVEEFLHKQKIKLKQQSQHLNSPCQETKGENSEEKQSKSLHFWITLKKIKRTKALMRQIHECQTSHTYKESH